MRVKLAFFVISAVAFFSSSVLGIVGTAAIDGVRDKDVLEADDLQVIDDFVVEAVAGLANMDDFTAISKVRAAIIARANSQKQSAAEQYSQQFSESAYRHLSGAFERIERLASEQDKYKVKLNLLILMGSLEDVRLLDLAIAQIADKGDVIRYWAVRCVANPVVIEKIKQLNPEDKSKQAARVLGKLEQIIEQSGPEVIALVAEFAARINLLEGQKLLVKIADMRIQRYADWTVTDELLDATILKFLCEKLAIANDPAAGRRFGQLYSYAIQKYISNLKGGNSLTNLQEQQLASVLAETEQSCIGELLGMPQTTIKSALDQNDYVGLQAEHDRLLGNQTRRGVLVERLKFDYGTEAGGTVRMAPLILPEPPKG